MKFDVITIFPDIFSGFVKESLISKAIKKRLISIRTHYLRDWTTDRHQTVDGKPYGGGPGLVMKVEPIYKAVKAVKLKVQSLPAMPAHAGQAGEKLKVKTVLFSPRGKKFDQAMAKKWAKFNQLIFICGRYEGVDERVADYIADEVVSIGDYVLNGGEVAAMVVIEAVARQLPGFMHTAESASKEDHAQYTKPEVFNPKGGRKNKELRAKGWRVPKVLLSGDHAKIKAWREEEK